VGANHSRGRRIRPAWVPPPRPSFRSVPPQSALEKRPSTGQGGSDNKPAPGDGDKECEKIFPAVITTASAPDAEQRGALAERCVAEPGSRLLAMRRNRGRGSAKRHEECRIAPGTRDVLRSVITLLAIEHAL